MTLAAVAESKAEAKVQALRQAGLPLTIYDLLCTVDRLAVAGVAALLSVGRPAVDTSQPGAMSYSCPIHRTLHCQVRCLCLVVVPPALRGSVLTASDNQPGACCQD